MYYQILRGINGWASITIAKLIKLTTFATLIYINVHFPLAFIALFFLECLMGLFIFKLIYLATSLVLICIL